jgi:VWFA-related protein
MSRGRAISAALKKFAVVVAALVATCWDVASTEQSPAFRTTAHLVRLDVSVLGKDGRPVRGLTPDDFEVMEDSVRQDLVAFQAVEVPDPGEGRDDWIDSVPGDVVSNERQPGRVFVIILDDALIPQDPSSVLAAKRIVRDVIAQLGLYDLAAIVFTSDGRNAQDFTDDRRRLLATLDRFAPGNATWQYNPLPGDIRVNPDSGYHLASLQTLINTIDTLAAIRHASRTIVWVTPGVPMDVGQAAPQRGDPRNTALERMAHLRLIDLSKDLLSRARLANVAIYPFDPCGLGGLGAISKGPSASQAMDFLVQAASSTGGRATVNTNAFGDGIRRVFVENGAYYVIGYQPRVPPTDGRFRRLEVRVTREGAHVRTNSGYRPDPPQPARIVKPAEVLEQAIAEPVAVRELPLAATAAVFAIDSGRRGAVAIALDVRQPIPDRPQGERVNITTELRTAAFSPDGIAKGVQRHTARVVVRPGATGSAQYEALSKIDLPPGRYRLRLAAYDTNAAKAGSVMLDVVVPDFLRESASVSGVILAVTPARPSAPRDLLQGLVPLVPTAQRTFRGGDRVFGFFKIYQPSSRTVLAATVRITLTDRGGQLRFEKTQLIGADRFVDPARPGAQVMTRTGFRDASSEPVAALRAADVEDELPIASLAPGDYVLAVAVHVGTFSVVREIRLSILPSR